MYLGVTYVSEICTVDGRYIANGVLNRERDADEYITTLTRAHQQKPNTVPEVGQFGIDSYPQ